VSLVTEGLAKRYGTTQAVAGVSLELSPGETLALLGPSGCGKSTLLRLVAGLEPPDAGRVLFAGRDLTRTPPQQRGFGMVFQDYALFPHLNVAENVAFGLRERGWAHEARQQRVAELLEQVGLAGFERRRVYELSGGQQQRVALARALAPKPALLLLDEPLSNLDLTLRNDLKLLLKELLGALDVGAIYVTHDQGEAFTLAERVALMREGKLVQVAPPAKLYARPISRWAARFLGHPNLFELREHPQLEAITRASAVLLRSDLLELTNRPRQGAQRAELRSHLVSGAAHTMVLSVPELAIDVTWQGTTRELPDLGAELWLRIPPCAVVPLEGG
jgi:ABC-type Fe3+/spermidine/putrescine transport system ATPase subunit